MSIITQEQGRESEHNEKEISVTVNGHPVVFTEKEASGAQIKATAIAQHAPHIQTDFLLFEKKGHDHQVQIGDNETVKLHKGQEFQAIADDDNS